MVKLSGAVISMRTKVNRDSYKFIQSYCPGRKCDLNIGILLIIVELDNDNLLLIVRLMPCLGSNLMTWVYDYFNGVSGFVKAYVKKEYLSQRHDVCLSEWTANGLHTSSKALLEHLPFLG